APGADAQAIARRFDIKVKKKLRFAKNTYVLNGVQASLKDAVAQLSQTPGVLVATTNRYLRFYDLPQIEPNDPLYNLQWPLHVEGGTNFWGISVGERFVNGPRRNVVIGLIDAGPQISHPDLADNVNPNGWDFTLDQPYDETQVPFALESH